MSKQKTTVSTKGHLIDFHCNYKNGLILESGSIVYDCTLNQTDIGSNKNKFYIMQIIKSGSEFIVFVRYGRIGITGNISHKKFTSEYAAAAFFEKQFRSKTGNSWQNKNNFVKQDGKYFLSVIECAELTPESDSVSDSESDSGSDSGSESDTETDSNSDSTTGSEDDRLVHFLELISNQSYMQNTLTELEIDTEKMPLGKISRRQIDAAYEILNRLNKNIGNYIVLEKLSSEFYTLIPIVCGRNKPPVMSTAKLIGKNVDMLNELSLMAYGTAVTTKQKKYSIMDFYSELQTDIVPLDPTDQMYKILSNYLGRSMAPTHHFGFDVLNILQIDRHSERDSYDAHSSNIKNKTLLFHGTRVSNMIGILKNGLIVDPSRLGINVSITGKMFGLGLYFANSCSKSIQYTNYQSSDNISCLFVAEVALGRMLKKTQSDCSLTASTLPKSSDSVWGRGMTTFAEYDLYDDLTQIPSGKLTKTNATDRSLLYDEFIVYKEEQINLRYVILLKIK